ncbi:imidazole glycerol phosphate synthase subunit HisF [Hyphomicrobium sp. xq]|uniref:Imidazole glycerol phosphate synthase subunit HisF n=1 Tax=Hyphomicrobium album TaxID=2665159 RepID=A0A6I3KLB1_9HYPH|nr:imidazole glycerol phosphate synthase cyclase subunit [Hyphomicrobium album]MTD94676.1 imidazole glycerol phosphate synthase subunit HisF [Hyphomicrobium album]
MLKPRLIPVLLLQNGHLVRSELFNIHQIIGNPVHEAERFNHWGVDELIYLDISRSDEYDLRRDDQKVRHLNTITRIQEAVSRTCFIPLTWGGRIRTLDDMASAFAHGADKVAVNSQALRTPELIAQASIRFGKQAIVVSIDVLRHGDGRWEVFIDCGRTPTGRDPVDWAIEAERLGAGEILLQSINRDGTGDGYDLDLIRAVAGAVRIPLIACSGVGRYEDYADGLRSGAAAVAAANIWHFKEMADRGGKRALVRAGFNVRI